MLAALSLVNAAPNRGLAGDSPGPPINSPALSITVHRAPSAAQYAPEAVWFYAAPSNFTFSTVSANSIAYDPAFHEVDYLWTFDVDGETFTVPGNMLPEHRDANKGVGQQIAHVFKQPGTYTVTCTARRRTTIIPEVTQSASAAVVVTIADPETVFDATNTVVVAHDADFTGAPASNYQLTGYTSTSDLAHWEGLLRNGAIPTSGPVRVLFKRGGNYDNSAHSDEGLAHNNTVGNEYDFVYIGAWGSGAKPISSPIDAWINRKSFVWENLEVQGGYISQATAGSGGNGISGRDVGYYLASNCDFRNLGAGVLYDWDTNTSSVEGRLTVHECSMENIYSYGTFVKMRPRGLPGSGTRDRFAMIGCREIDLPTQPHGVGVSEGQRQGPMRSPENPDLCVRSCEFYCDAGWTGLGDWDDLQSMTAAQPTIRFADGRPTEGDDRNGDAVISRCTNEGAALIDANPGSDEEPRVGNITVLQCVHTFVPNSNLAVKSKSGAISLRNNLFINSAATGNDDGEKRQWMEFDPSHSTNPNPTQKLAEPIIIEGNTFVSLGTDRLDNHFNGLPGTWTDVREVNNVYYAPNATGGYSEHENFAPFDTAVLWAPRFTGRHEWVSGAVEALQTAYATPASTIALYAPLTGSSVLGDATTGTISLVDLRGDDRASPPSRGASKLFVAPAPAAFGSGDWSIADAESGGDLAVTLTTVPTYTTDVEYRLDGGSWVSSGGIVGFTISGLTDDTEYDVEIRATNAAGDSAASDTKSETPTSAVTVSLIGTSLSTINSNTTQTYALPAGFAVDDLIIAASASDEERGDHAITGTTLLIATTGYSSGDGAQIQGYRKAITSDTGVEFVNPAARPNPVALAVFRGLADPVVEIDRPALSV